MDPLSKIHEPRLSLSVRLTKWAGVWRSCEIDQRALTSAVAEEMV